MNEEQLDELAADLDLIVGFVTVGTADRPFQVRRVKAALQHMRDWRAARTPRHGTVGGSSSPTEEEDGREDAAVTRQVQRDEEDTRMFLADLARTAAKLRRIVLRNTETYDASKLPAAEVPGCVSCARTEIDPASRLRMGNHFAPVMPAKDEKIDGKMVRGNAEANRLGLCRNCWDHTDAEGKPPPVQYCHLLHTQGTRSAGNWLAKRERAA